MMTHHGCADFFWNGPVINFNPKNVYAYVEGEYGFIPLITGKALEGKTKSYVDIISSKQNIEAYNRMPSLVSPAWTLTQISRDTVTLAITNWHPLNGDMGANDDMWSDCYPLLRDILVALKQQGCETFNFFTTMNNHEAQQQAEILVYDMHNDIRPTQELILAPPAWMAPFIANKIGLRSGVICVTQDEGLFVDSQALSIAKEFFTAVGLPYDEKRAENTLKTVKNMEDTLSHQRWMDEEDGDEGGWLV